MESSVKPTLTERYWQQLTLGQRRLGPYLLRCYGVGWLSALAVGVPCQLLLPEAMLPRVDPGESLDFWFVLSLILVAPLVETVVIGVFVVMFDYLLKNYQPDPISRQRTVVVLSAVLFGLLHASSYPAFGVAQMAIGVAFCMVLVQVRQRWAACGGLAACAAIHAAHNATIVLVLLAVEVSGGSAGLT